MGKKLLSICLGITIVMCSGMCANAITITLVDTHDTFFTTNPTARAALDAAAADVSAAITTSLTEITAAQDTIVGTNGSTTASFDWGFSYTNPTTLASETYNPTAT